MIKAKELSENLKIIIKELDKHPDAEIVLMADLLTYETEDLLELKANHCEINNIFYLDII